MVYFKSNKRFINFIDHLIVIVINNHISSKPIIIVIINIEYQYFDYRFNQNFIHYLIHITNHNFIQNFNRNLNHSFNYNFNRNFIAQEIINYYFKSDYDQIIQIIDQTVNDKTKYQNQLFDSKNSFIITNLIIDNC